MFLLLAGCLQIMESSAYSLSAFFMVWACVLLLSLLLLPHLAPQPLALAREAFLKGYRVLTNQVKKKRAPVRSAVVLSSILIFRDQRTGPPCYRTVVDLVKTSVQSCSYICIQPPFPSLTVNQSVETMQRSCSYKAAGEEVPSASDSWDCLALESVYGPPKTMAAELIYIALKNYWPYNTYCRGGT